MHRPNGTCPKKQSNNGLAEPLLLLVVFLEGTRLFSSFSLAFTYVKELELPATNVVKSNKPVVLK